MDNRIHLSRCLYKLSETGGFLSFISLFFYIYTAFPSVCSTIRPFTMIQESKAWPWRLHSIWMTAAKFDRHILQILSHQSSFKRNVAIFYILNLVCILPFLSDAWGALVEMGGTCWQEHQVPLKGQKRLVPEMCMSIHPFQASVSMLLIRFESKSTSSHQL